MLYSSGAIDFTKTPAIFNESFSSPERSSRFIRIYIANGTVGMMREWVNTGFRISSQDLAEMMYFLSKKISQY